MTARERKIKLLKDEVFPIAIILTFIVLISYAIYALQ